MQAPAAPREGHQMNRVVEIRSYNLKSGTRERFHQRFLREALPMLRRWKIDVVAYGPSLHDSDSYYLMRSYSSAQDRQRSEDAFYGSDQWKQGPREAILADIESYATVVIGVDDVTLQGLRRVGPHEVAVKEHAVQTGFALASDLATWTELNRSQTSDFQLSTHSHTVCRRIPGSWTSR
jgi:NIPSNAP